MSDEQDTLPPGSQLSTSDLSEPPNIKDDEEYKEIHVKFTTPPTSIPSRPELAAENSIAVLPEDDPSSSSRPRRATRNVRPVRYSANDDEIAAEAEVSLEATKKRVPAKRSNTNGSVDTVTKKPAAKRAKPTPRAKKSKWDPKYVTENERSPLANVDLRSLLLQPAAWDCLTAEDQQEILALMPDGFHILNFGTKDARPDFQSLRNDDNFRHDCDQYVANLANGMHDSTWLKDAWNAHERRNAGQFDEFHIRKLELDWGATIPDEHKPEHLRSRQNGQSSTSISQPTDNRVFEGQGEPESFTSQKFALKVDDKEKTKKKKVAAAVSRSKKGAKVAEDLMVMDSIGDSIEVAMVDTDKACTVNEDAEKNSKSVSIDVDKNGNSVGQIAEACNGDPSFGKATTSMRQADTADGGSEVKSVVKPSLEKDSMDIDRADE